MVEENVIQSESVAPAEQPVAETPALKAPDETAEKPEKEGQIAPKKAEKAQ